MTVYLMGVFTRVHRRSGLVGLIAGSSYGILAVIGSSLEMLPVWLTDRFVAYLWSIAITSSAMILCSLVLRRAAEQDALGTIFHLSQHRYIFGAWNQCQGFSSHFSSVHLSTYQFGK